jgi:anaerobic magnesium-protoporphyrin IX monomethyl ester cyclase
MKVALIVPESGARQPGLKLNDTCAPLNLGHLASYLRLKKPYVTVKIIDGVAGMNVTQELFKFQPDIVGVTATTPQVPNAYSVGDMLKKNRPDIYTVIGGVHASALPSEAAGHFDCVVVGEGEQALVNIADSFEQGKRLHGIIIGEPVACLDDLPMPAYDLIRLDEYLKHGPTFPGLKFPVLSMITSRGCPFACPFCYNSNRSYPPRWFSAGRVVDELEYLLNHYRISSFFFSDDEFLVNKKRLAEIGRLLDERSIRIVWGCQARVNSISMDVLLVAKRMGCVVISPGFESMVPRILKYLKCGTTTVEANERALWLAEKAGVLMGGNFVFGTPTETLEEMKVTFSWCMKQGSMKWINLNSLVPFPGTAVYKSCRRNGLLPERLDYERFVITNHVKQTYVVDSAVDMRVYNRFLVHAQRITWVLSFLRCGNSFRSLLGDLHLWYLWVFHPVKLLRMLRCRLKHEPIVC